MFKNRMNKNEDGPTAVLCHQKVGHSWTITRFFNISHPHTADARGERRQDPISAAVGPTLVNCNSLPRRYLASIHTFGRLLFAVQMPTWWAPPCSHLFGSSRHKSGRRSTSIWRHFVHWEGRQDAQEGKLYNIETIHKRGTTLEFSNQPGNFNTSKVDSKIFSLDLFVRLKIRLVSASFKAGTQKLTSDLSYLTDEISNFCYDNFAVQSDSEQSTLLSKSFTLQLGAKSTPNNGKK